MVKSHSPSMKKPLESIEKDEPSSTKRGDGIFRLDFDGSARGQTSTNLGVFSFLEFLIFKSLVAFARPVKFAVIFSFGNLLAIGSTAFVIGLARQARMMFDPVRIYATAIYIGSVVLALVCALCFHNKILTILAIIIEICALIWYSLSYIPFARRMVSELITSCGDTEI